MKSDTYKTLALEQADGVMTATLNRPNKLNAINGQMHDELLDLFGSVDGRPGCRVLVLTGAGRGFCAGGDVSEMPGAEDQDQLEEIEDLYLTSRPLVEALLRVQTPIVAMVNGPASGLGATLALFSDIVICSTDAFFADSHVDVGLVAGDGGAAIWPLLVGVSRAKEMLMTGRRIPGDEAERLGLVNHAVAAEDLRDVTMELAAELAAKPPFAVRATKASINRHLRRSVQETLDVSGAWQLISLKSEEHEAAVKAFAERRK